MNTIYILVVVSLMQGGVNVTFQEFYSLQECEKNATYIKKLTIYKYHERIKDAYCTKK